MPIAITSPTAIISSTPAGHSIYQPSTGPIPPGIYVSSTIRRQPHEQQQKQLKSQQCNQQQQQQVQKKPSPDSVETIPNCNSIDSAMFERDKQIYRCSTLRQGGKFDPKYKPMILNCPLPEIPKEATTNMPSKKEHDQGVNYSRTIQRPPMKISQVKAIPPPKIENQTFSKNSIQQHSTFKHKDDVSNKIKSPPPNKDIIANNTANLNTSNGNGTNQEGNNINPDDDSNYAVTEL